MSAKTVRKTLFRLPQLGSRPWQEGRETVLNSEYSKDSRGFTANGQIEGVNGWESIKRHQGKGDSCSTGLTGFLLKAGRGLRHQE